MLAESELPELTVASDDGDSQTNSDADNGIGLVQLDNFARNYSQNYSRKYRQRGHRERGSSAISDELQPLPSASKSSTAGRTVTGKSNHEQLQGDVFQDIGSVSANWHSWCCKLQLRWQLAVSFKNASIWPHGSFVQSCRQIFAYLVCSSDAGSSDAGGETVTTNVRLHLFTSRTPPQAVSERPKIGFWPSRRGRRTNSAIIVSTHSGRKTS
eukprot:SAG31_NODE_4929_length_2855_cov_1.699057_6_plen_212_part_00